MIQAGAQEDKLSPADAKRVIEKRASEAIGVIKNKDFQHLSRLTHPDKGLIFSPYPFVSGREKPLSKKELRNLSLEDKAIFQVVPQEGSGDDVNYSLADYFKRFVYGRDFAQAPKVSYNEHLSEGNCSIDLDEKLPGSIIVEYYFPGFDPKRDGMDWESLFLAFEKADDGNWYLVDIAHDSWCI